MTSATEFIDEPDTIRNEAVDNGLLVIDNRTTEYRISQEINLFEIADKYAKRLQEQVDEMTLDKAADALAKFGYVKVMRCRDCVYYDGEPDMESMGEKCWRDPSHSGRSMPTVADGYCWRGKRKEGGDD